MNKTMNQSAIPSLIANGRTMIDLRVSDAISRIMPDFIRLTEESEAFRTLWLVDRSREEKKPNDGLIERTPEGGYDSKFFFHYRLGLERYLKQQGADLRTYARFLEGMSELYEACAFASAEILIRLDQALPGFNLLDNHAALADEDRGVLRLLRYKPGSEILAKAHCDRSFLTLHMDESHSGLYLDQDRRHFVVEKDRALCFFGQKAEVITRGALPAMFHYVKATAPDEWRWAVVYFCHVDAPISEAHLTEIIKTGMRNFKYS
jgi:hypothetical protein